MYSLLFVFVLLHVKNVEFHHSEGLIARADRSPSTPAALSLSTKPDWYLSPRQKSRGHASDV